jgi:hypothetical protein
LLIIHTLPIFVVFELEFLSESWGLWSDDCLGIFQVQYHPEVLELLAWEWLGETVCWHLSDWKKGCSVLSEPFVSFLLSET